MKNTLNERKRLSYKEVTANVIPDSNKTRLIMKFVLIPICIGKHNGSRFSFHAKFVLFFNKILYPLILIRTSTPLKPPLILVSNTW